MLIVGVGGFEVSFRKEDGVIREVARAGPPGKRGTDFFIPEGEYRSMLRAAHTAFHEFAAEREWREPQSVAGDVARGLAALALEGEPWPKPQSQQQLRQLELPLPRVPTYPCADFQS